MAELKTFAVPEFNYMKNLLHGSVSVGLTASATSNVVAVTGDPNFFVFVENSSGIESIMYGGSSQILSAAYIEGGYLKVNSNVTGTYIIHYGIYIDD